MNEDTETMFETKKTSLPLLAFALALALALTLGACGKTKPAQTDGSVTDAAGDTSTTDTSTADVGGNDVDGSDAGGDATDGAPTDGPSADASGDATALPKCSSLTNPVYVMSGDTQVPILKELGKAMRQDAANPVTIVWQGTGSCTIIDAVYNGTPLKQNLSYIPADPNWNAATGAVPTCTPDAAGAPVQLGIPIVYPESCTTTTPPATVKAFKGPVQSFVFVVPKASTAQGISAEEAYVTFGFGTAGGVAPWTDETFFYVRPASKGTQVSLGAVIGVPAAKWKGLQIDQSTVLASMLAATTAPQKALGILGSEIYDSAANRAALRALSFEAYGQASGYLPDTTVTAFDKRNVRDGHYAAWSHVFYLTSVDNAGKPTNAAVAKIVEVFTTAPGAAAPTGVDPLTLVAGKGLVPLCAMNVQRAAEGGPLTVSQPAQPCGCFYESLVSAATPTSCIVCSATAPCAAAGTTCVHGFCEATDGRTSLVDCATAPATDAAIPNHACTARTVAAAKPLPQKQVDNGGTLPPLP